MSKPVLTISTSVGSNGRQLARPKELGKFELEQSPTGSGVWDLQGFKQVELPTGKELEIHCEWTSYGVHFSAGHEGHPYSIGIKTSGPFEVCFYFPDNDSYIARLEGEKK